MADETNTPPTGEQKKGAAKADATATREVRILTAFDEFEVNQIVELDDKAAQAAIDASLADDDADAIAYAKSLAAEA